MSEDQGIPLRADPLFWGSPDPDYRDTTDRSRAKNRTEPHLAASFASGGPLLQALELWMKLAGGFSFGGVDQSEWHCLLPPLNVDSYDLWYGTGAGPGPAVGCFTFIRRRGTEFGQSRCECFVELEERQTLCLIPCTTLDESNVRALYNTDAVASRRVLLISSDLNRILLFSSCTFS